MRTSGPRHLMGGCRPETSSESEATSEGTKQDTMIDECKELSGNAAASININKASFRSDVAVKSQEIIKSVKLNSQSDVATISGTNSHPNPNNPHYPDQSFDSQHRPSRGSNMSKEALLSQSPKMSVDVPPIVLDVEDGKNVTDIPEQ